ncbi:hypothetical protein KGA66_28690 [Actinocrinis puniceicyclus]|uniref:Uncharacterized protein n=1 Tax=Actinocrinis puniceicyclus TaxID=977794 RepID=A0A8J8BFU8_9ACTN|nr:hypothetical protein [Actinocrinis puniceicyclus]MBS2967045.1 hypothetical protein [Actinocrinis puniceicyclus]
MPESHPADFNGGDSLPHADHQRLRRQGERLFEFLARFRLAETHLVREKVGRRVTRRDPRIWCHNTSALTAQRSDIGMSCGACQVFDDLSGWKRPGQTPVRFMFVVAMTLV